MSQQSLGILREQNEFIVFWKLTLTLHSLKWPKAKRNQVRNLIPKVSETLNKLLGVDLLNFSCEFLKASYNTDLRASGLKWFYSLILSWK